MLFVDNVSQSAVPVFGRAPEPPIHHRDPALLRAAIVLSGAAIALVVAAAFEWSSFHGLRTFEETGLSLSYLGAAFEARRVVSSAPEPRAGSERGNERPGARPGLVPGG